MEKVIIYYITSDHSAQKHNNGSCSHADADRCSLSLLLDFIQSTFIFIFSAPSFPCSLNIILFYFWKKWILLNFGTHAQRVVCFQRGKFQAMKNWFLVGAATIDTHVHSLSLSHTHKVDIIEIDNFVLIIINVVCECIGALVSGPIEFWSTHFALRGCRIKEWK